MLFSKLTTVDGFNKKSLGLQKHFLGFSLLLPLMESVCISIVVNVLYMLCAIFVTRGATMIITAVIALLTKSYLTLADLPIIFECDFSISNFCKTIQIMRTDFHFITISAMIDFHSSLLRYPEQPCKGFQRLCTTLVITSEMM